MEESAAQTTGGDFESTPQSNLGICGKCQRRMSHDIPQPGLSQGEGARALRLWKHQRGIGRTANRVPQNVTGEILSPAERMQVRAGIKARFKRILKVIVGLRLSVPIAFQSPWVPALTPISTGVKKMTVGHGWGRAEVSVSWQKWNGKRQIIWQEQNEHRQHWTRPKTAPTRWPR